VHGQAPSFQSTIADTPTSSDQAVSDEACCAAIRALYECREKAGLAQLVEHLICNKFIYFHKVSFYQQYQRTIKTLLIHNTFT
jgi:hypothetical protein